MSADAEDHVVVNRASGRWTGDMGTEVRIRDFAIVSDEPPSRGGADTGPTPLELLMGSLCACTTVSAKRMADKLRFSYIALETVAEGELDTRGRKGEAAVPVHHRAVRLTVRIATRESDARLERLADLVGRYCPVDSLMRHAIPDYEVTWERA